MTPMRFDQLQFSSTLPNFINVNTPVAYVTVSGTVANSTSSAFRNTFNLDPGVNFVDVKMINQNTGDATYITSPQSISTIYQAVSSERSTAGVTYGGGFQTGQLFFSINISNFTGAAITLISQTYTIEIIEYTLPF